MQDIVVAEAETLRVPKLSICNLLVPQANILELGMQSGGQLALHEVCALELVRSFHLGNRQLEGALERRYGWNFLEHIDDACSVLDSLERDWIIPH